MASKPDLRAIVLSTPATVLQPLAFFVSWQGVLVLAYNGFPKVLVTLKQKIAEHWPVLPKENPGSLWPKTTIAPLKDDQRLTPEQLQRLFQICRHYSGALQMDLVTVDRIALATYTCRSLEQLFSVECFRLKDADGASANEPCCSSREQTSRVLSEADAPDYWFAASRDGSRESHYRAPALGSTLMLPIAEALKSPQRSNEVVADTITMFRNAVEREFPGMYAWLNPSSYHVTLRAIIS